MAGPPSGEPAAAAVAAAAPGCEGSVLFSASMSSRSFWPWCLLPAVAASCFSSSSPSPPSLAKAVLRLVGDRGYVFVSVPHDRLRL